MSAIMISTIKVKNPEKLQEYLKKVKRIGDQLGAEMLFNGPAIGTILGKLDHQMVIAIKFPSLEAIDQLFASDEYQPLIPLRNEAAEMQIIKYQHAN